MERSDYPQLFQSATVASAQAKKSYFKLKDVELFFLVASAFFGCFAFQQSMYSKLYGLISALAIITSLICSIMSRVLKLEETWANCRTVSESVKKATWNYMMWVPPYNVQSAQAADAEYVLVIDELHDSISAGKDQLTKNLGSGDQITNKMREVRSRNWEERRDIYLNARVQDQQNWYATNAKDAGNKQWWLSVGTTVLEILTVVFILMMILGWAPVQNIIGFCTTAITCGLAWAQLRRLKQISKIYSDTAQYLGSQKALGRHIGSHAALEEYVRTVEDLISRENTNWAIIRS